MENQSGLKFHGTLNNVRLHFDFLFKRGFRIVAVLFAGEGGENWQITLMSGDRLIEIYSEQSKVNLALGILQLNNEIKYFDLEETARFVTKGGEILYRSEGFTSDEVQQIKQTARFFEKNSEALWVQVEQKSLLILKHPVSKSAHQQKRTII